MTKNKRVHSYLLNKEHSYLLNKEKNLLNFGKYLTQYTNEAWLINHNLFKSYKINKDCHIVFSSKLEYTVSTRRKDFFTIYQGDSFQLFIESSKFQNLEDNLFDSGVCKNISNKNLSDLFKNAFD